MIRNSGRCVRIAASLGVAALCAAFAVSAHANTLTVTAQLGVAPSSIGNHDGGLEQLTNFGGTATTADGSFFLAAAQYNPAQHLFAQLTSVSISFVSIAAQSYTFTNNSGGSAGTVTNWNIIDTVSLFAPGTTTPSITTSAATTNLGSFTIPASGTVSGTNNPTGGTGTANPVNFVAYTGSGTVQFDISSVAGTTGSKSPFVTFSDTTFAGATVTITYTFTPVPEPGAWAFLAGGFVTGGFALRRKRLLTRRA